MLIPKVPITGFNVASYLSYYNQHNSNKILANMINRKVTPIKPTSKTKGKGFSSNSPKSFKQMVQNNKLIKEYEMYLDRLYTQGIQHSVIYSLANELAELKGITADELLEATSSAVQLGSIVKYMTENSEYPEDECKEYIKYRAFMANYLDNLNKETEAA